MEAGFSSDGSTVFPSERPHESQFGGFETGSCSLDERSWADETEWTTPDNLQFLSLTEYWTMPDNLPSQEVTKWLKHFDGELGAIKEPNEILGCAMNGEPVDSLNDHQSNQIETSEASFKTETGGGGKSNLTPAQREKKRKNDAKYRKNIEEKIRFLHGLVPGCSKDTQKLLMLDETINYVQSLLRQVEEAAEQIAENKHLKKENEQLNAENTRLKDQLGLLVKQHRHQSVSVLLGNDQHATNFEAVDKLVGVGSFLGKRSSMSFSGIDGCEEANGEDHHDNLSDDGSQLGEKKNRLNMEQVKTLEKNFELSNKLEPKRKIQLARALGLKPRQIAIWFHNRRARWKTKQLEKDFDLLKRQYHAIKAANDALQAHNKKLHAEISSLKPNKFQILREIVPVNAASLTSEGDIILPNVNQCQFNVKPQLNATEAPRDSCLQVEEIPHNNDRGSESFFPSNEEAKQGTCGSHNQHDEDEFSGGAEEEPLADGIGGEPSGKVLSSNKRKRSIEDAEVDQVKRGLEEKDSDESQEKRDCNLTTTTYMSTRKEGREGCQASDPPKEENIHIQSQRGQANNSLSRAERDAIQNINERMKILQDLVPGCSKVAGKATMLDEIINYLQSLQRQVELLSTKLSAFNPVSNGIADVASTDILMKLEADDESTLKFSDFTGLDGERIKVGKYSVPLSLHLIVQNIIDDYGDVTASCKMNPCAAEANYIMFCASIKEMSDLWLKQVNEDRILKWRDAINDALRINFKVDFAMKHLKKITCAYIGLMERRKLDNVALRIVHFEAQLRAEKEEHAKICIQSKAFIDAAEEFNEKPVISGIFQILPVVV